MKTKGISIIIALLLIMSVLGGCGSSKGTSDSGKLVDGTYKAEYADFDSHGYKPQIEITVSGGKITAVKYDEVSKDGVFKSQDADYKKTMEEASGTNPEKAYTALNESLIAKQSADVDTVAGATASTKTFKSLAKYAIDEMAKKGNTTTGKVPVGK